MPPMAPLRDDQQITLPARAHIPRSRREPTDRGSRLSLTNFNAADHIIGSPTPAIPPPKLEMPPKKQPPWLRKLRHVYLAVYQRLFTIVFFANLVGLIILFNKVDPSSPQMLSNLATASSANILLAIAIRQQWIINLIFKTCWIIPKTAPLRIRCMLAKCYEFGGVHSGAAVSSTAWFTVFTAVLIQQIIDKKQKDITTLALACVLLLLLSMIVIFALPSFRQSRHNTFEVIHRFAGWLSLILFWVELLVFTRAQINNLPTGTARPPYGKVLIMEPAFWFLIVTTCMIIWPWTLLRKLYIRPEFLSDRAVRLHFENYKVPSFTGIAISTSPLLEWHSFACMASPPDGGSVLISNGGDWTRDTVMSPKPYYWVRGLPVTGVLNMSQAFDKVVIVTTGSGIGPVLSYLIGVKRHGSCRIIWSVPDPLLSYGKEIIATVKKIDPEAMIIDTKINGRPDLVGLAYQLYVESKAEAVFTISNPRLTSAVVYGMSARGIPGFGPVWDS